MLTDSINGPFAAVIYHRWNSTGHGSSSELSKGSFWQSLRETRWTRRREQGSGSPGAALTHAGAAPGDRDPHRVPVTTPHFATTSLSPSERRRMGGEAVTAAAVPDPARGWCCHNKCHSCCLLAGLKRQLNALEFRLPLSPCNSLSCLQLLCTLMPVPFPEQPRNASAHLFHSDVIRTNAFCFCICQRTW